MSAATNTLSTRAGAIVSRRRTDLWESFKSRCTERGWSMAYVLTALLTAYVEGRITVEREDRVTVTE